MPQDALVTVTLALNERLAGLSIHEIRRTLPDRLRDSASDESEQELINIFMQSGAELFDLQSLDASKLHLGPASVRAAHP